MKIFLAATGGYEEVRSKSIYALDTFYYADEDKPNDHRRFEDYLLDSGAFTFQEGGKRKESMEEYCERYANYIVKNDIKNYFEMDIDILVGYDKVLEIRKYLEKKTDRPCIPVWHINRGKQDFVDMCKRYNYVSMGGIAGIRSKTEDYYKYLELMVNEAHRHHAKIHGLGFTKIDKLRTIHWDSVDSTSWLNAGKYGTFMRFTGDNVTRIPHPKGTHRIIGSREATIQGGLEWVKFQKYAKTHL